MRLFLFLLCLFLLTGCPSGGNERPLGVVRLGAWEQIQAEVKEEKIYSDYRILLRRSADGWSAMSLLCTIDQSDLTPVMQGGVRRWRSMLSGAEYEDGGRVLSGSKHDLPYYEMYVDQGPPGTPHALYVYIGKKVAPQWRFAPVKAASVPTAGQLSQGN